MSQALVFHPVSHLKRYPAIRYSPKFSPRTLRISSHPPLVGAYSTTKVIRPAIAVKRSIFFNTRAERVLHSLSRLVRVAHSPANSPSLYLRSVILIRQPPRAHRIGRLSCHLFRWPTYSRLR